MRRKSFAKRSARRSSDNAAISDELRNAQQTAPFGDAQGLVAATLQDGDTLPPLQHCLSTPFQCIAARVGLAATTWAIFAEIGFDTLSTPLDTTAPDTSITAGPTEGSTTADSTPTFEFTSTEAGSSFECRIDSIAESAFAPCWSPNTIPSLGDGQHTFAVRGVDAAGNADQSPETRTFTVQAPQPPIFTATDPVSPANDNTPLIKGTATSTVKLYTSSDCSGTPVTTGASADFAEPGLEVTVADDTTTTFHATATAADNTSDCSTDSITYVEDSTAPNTTISSGPSGTTNGSTPVSRGFIIDTQPPHARLFGKRRQRAGKPIAIKVRCAEGCALVATGRVVVWGRPRGRPARAARRSKVRFGLKRLSRQLSAGRTASLRLRLRNRMARRRLRRLVRRGRKARAGIRVRFVDRAGNWTIARLTVRLRRR